MHRAALADDVTYILELCFCCEGVLYFYVTAQTKRRYERVCVCLYVRVALTLQQVSFLTLEGMRMFFHVVSTALETASAALSQFSDGALETTQNHHL